MTHVEADLRREARSARGGLRLLAALLVAVAPMCAQTQDPPTRPDGESRRPQNGEAATLDRLRADLAQPGAEGARQRLAAIEHLLSLSDDRPHQMLAERIATTEDPDGVRAPVLEALVRRLRNPVDPVFGETAPREPKLRIVRAYAEALATFWFDDSTIEGVPPGPLGALAREAIVLMPARALIEAQRQILSSPDATIALRIATLRAAGDTQDLQFGGMLADFLADKDPAIRRAASTALRYLTFHDATFENREQYEAWGALNERRTYVELAEDAARRAARREREHVEQIAALQRSASADLVRALTEKRKAIDWAEVGKLTLTEDPESLSGCLAQLRRTLAEGVANDEGQGRAAFARDLVQRYRMDAPQDRAMRPMLLEVAASVVRAADAEAYAEVGAELLAQLASPDPALQSAALRSMRRFQSPESRAAIVAVATAAMARGGDDPVFAQALGALSATGEGQWRSPAEGGIGRAEWHALIKTVCVGDFPRERRNEAVAMALLVDRDGKRAPESFELLLGIAKDPAREPDFRNACLIHLQSWREDAVRAGALVEALTALLGDSERDVRLFAAESLTRLPEGAEEQKAAWIRGIVDRLRDLLQVETNSAVVRAMLACLVACTREPGKPEAAIGALNVAIEEVGKSASEDAQSRVSALLQTLTEIAADPRAGQGQWVGACDMLVRHQRRRMLRHVLVSHNAISLAKDLRSSDQILVGRARSAVRFVLLAAISKPEDETWESSDELRREAADVRAVFESAPQGMKLPDSMDAPAFRLLRLQVLLATGGHKEVVALSRVWLEERDPKDWEPLSPFQQETVRYLCAEAQARDGKLADAVQTLARLPQGQVPDPRLVGVAERLGRAFLATDAGRAVEWLTVSVRGTKDEDPAMRDRLVALWEARLAHAPQERASVLAEVDRKIAMFEAADCPENLKQAVARLRAQKGN